MTKYYAQEKRVFDINKITVVGSPTITSDGVTSWLHQTGYLTVPFIDFKNKAFSYKTRIKFDRLTSLRTTVFGEQSLDYLLPLLCFEGTHPRVYVPTDGTEYTSSTITSFTAVIDTWYDIELIVDLTNLIVKIDDEVIFTTPCAGITYDIGSNVVCIGTQMTNDQWELEGSIDLKQFKIYVDGELIYSPTKPTYYLERRKEGFDLSKFKVVGSPTITEDGVATYAGGLNYVYIPPIDYTKPFAIRKIGFTYKTGTLATYFINGGNINKDWGGFVFGANKSSNKLRCFLGSTGTSWDILMAFESQTILSTNTVYYMDLVYSGSNYTIILYDNNLNELERKVVNNSTPLYQSGNGIMIGSNFINTVVYDGNIYLSNITIENDGKEVFTGAKEKFYAMRGGK